MMNALYAKVGLNKESCRRRTSWLLVWIALILVNDFPGFYFQDKIPHIVAIFCVWGIYFGVLKLGQLFILRFLPFLIGPAGIEIVAVIYLILSIDEIQSATVSLGPRDDGWLLGISVALVLLIWLFVWGIERRKQMPMAAVVALAAFIAVVFVCVYPGKMHRGEIQDGKREIPKQYDVEKISYGPDQSLNFGTENYRAYASFPRKQAKLRKRTLGFDLKDVPYEGDIYLPKGKKDAPLLVFVHGNHNMLADNRGGYAYLGEYLAERGIAFVSVEQSYLNAYLQKGLSSENDARALSLIDHAEKIVNHPDFAQRFDGNRIYFGGHSRGGEAAAVAASFTALSRNPDTAEKTKDLAVAGVLAVAPTDGQYEPGDKPVDIDVDYLIVQGTHDQDVSSMEGMDQYMRASGKKRQILIDYANHTQFNDDWGRLDREGLEALALHTADILTKAHQQDFLKVIAYGFIEDEAIFEHLNAYVPSVNFAMANERQALVFANFEEDVETATGSFEGVEITSNDHREGVFSPASRGGANHVATIYKPMRISTPVAMAGDFALDVSAKREAAAFKLKLIDESGAEILVESKEKDHHLALKTALLKYQDLTGEYEYKTALETFRLTEEEILAINPDFQIKALRGIEIMPEKEIQVDNIRIEPTLD